MTEWNTKTTEISALTKRRKETGNLYLRRTEVELQIGAFILLEKTVLLKYLTERKRDSANYIFDETLVYLLRAARIQNDDLMIEKIYLELNARVWKLLNKFKRNFSNRADFEDFGQKVELAIIEKIFDIESDSADYAQVNFGDFVITLAKVVWRGTLIRVQREQQVFQAERNDQESDQPEIQFASGEITPEEKLILREGIAKLPENIRTVAILILDGWQIESKDETQPTISKLLKVSSRTIRNWLKEARQLLAGYEGEIR